MSDVTVIQAEDVRKTIKDFNAVIKAIRTTTDSNRNWTFLLDQIANPQKNRAIKPIPANRNRQWAFNPKTEQWHKTQRQPQRGSEKDTSWTKKTSVSLLPPELNMNFFTYDTGMPIGLIFDIQQINLKDEKYIFPNNIQSDQKPWLKDKNKSLSEQSPLKSIGLEALRSRYSEQGPLKDWNELLVGLSKESVLGIYFNQDILLHRLRALTIKKLVKEKLNLDVPIFWMSSETGMQNYTVQQQIPRL